MSTSNLLEVFNAINSLKKLLQATNQLVYSYCFSLIFDALINQSILSILVQLDHLGTLEITKNCGESLHFQENWYLCWELTKTIADSGTLLQLGLIKTSFKAKFGTFNA